VIGHYNKGTGEMWTRVSHSDVKKEIEAQNHELTVHSHTRIVLGEFESDFPFSISVTTRVYAWQLRMLGFILGGPSVL